MRVVKDAEIRKNEILDAAGELFAQKGFDKTTISDIIEKVGVARGTVYYHFRSKEEVMDALIERHHLNLLTNAEKIAGNKGIPVLERLFGTLLAMHDTDTSDIHNDLHKPQNALMHQKVENLMMRDIPPILMEIVKDGIREGLFDTPYPYETVEMVQAHINTVFDSNYMERLSEEDKFVRIKAFLYNLDKLFGAKDGTFEPIIRMFDMERLPE